MAVPQSRKAPCFGCLGDCLRWDYQSKDGRRGKFMCQSATFYQPMAEMVYGRDYEVPFRANKLCDEYGLGTMAVTLVLVWMIRGLREAILTDESTGIRMSRVGSVEFIETLVRKIALREGFGDPLARGAEDDRLPDHWHTAPLKFDLTNPDLLLPGRGNEAVSMKGRMVDRSQFEAMKREYYALRGWEPDTGQPTASTLRALGLADVAADLRT